MSILYLASVGTWVIFLDSIGIQFLSPCFREEAIGTENHATLDEAQIPELEDMILILAQGFSVHRGFGTSFSIFSGLYFLTFKGAL